MTAAAYTFTVAKPSLSHKTTAGKRKQNTAIFDIGTHEVYPQQMKRITYFVARPNSYIFTKCATQCNTVISDYLI